MKLLSAAQMQDWDAYTIQHESITSINLMERAATACTKFIVGKGLAEQPIKIFCGKGNNGGDGLVIARQLIQQHCNPIVYILEFGAKGTDDFQVNLQRLHLLTKEIHFIQSEAFFPSIDEGDTVVDALYGSGMNRPLQDLSKVLVEHINNAHATVICIDVPSGMFIDKTCKGNAVVKANYTLTFQTLKLCFLVAENAMLFGEVIVLDIGLLPAFMELIAAEFEVVSEEQIAGLLKPRLKFSHKGTYGHALLIAGNKGKMGAAILAAKGCLRTGVGLLTVYVADDTLDIIQTTVPEAMTVLHDAIEYEKYAAIGIGPGMGTDEDAANLLLHVFSNYRKPMVIDADALNIIALDKKYRNLSNDSVITPHPKEFERLFGVFENDFERIEKAIKLSQQYPITIVLKGSYTLIANKGKGWFNLTGNSGMATGGSGDVLTGMITALLAQKYTTLDAALIGVYIHGLAADMGLENQSEESLLPSDIIENIGKSFKLLRQ